MSKRRIFLVVAAILTILSVVANTVSVQAQGPTNPGKPPVCKEHDRNCKPPEPPKCKPWDKDCHPKPPDCDDHHGKDCKPPKPPVVTGATVVFPDFIICTLDRDGAGLKYWENVIGPDNLLYLPKGTVSVPLTNAKGVVVLTATVGHFWNDPSPDHYLCTTK